MIRQAPHRATDHDARTIAERRATDAVLRLYFGGTLDEADQPDPLLSPNDIANGLARLKRDRPDLAVVLLLVYRDGWEPKQVASKLHLSENTVYTRRRDALDYLIGCTGQEGRIA